MRVYVVRKWPLRRRSRFVCWNITRVRLWLLCNVHFVQSICPTIATENIMKSVVFSIKLSDLRLHVRPTKP